MPDTLDGLQLILGTDKRNPAFCLYTDATAQALHVYYGLELLEVVPNDRASPAFRLLAARLYNAGLRVATLVALFDLDPKTLRTWGRALRSGDRDWLARVLAGRWGRRKLTPALESYVRQRWPLLRAQGVRDYRQRLRAELERVFGVTVAGETLRPLLRQLRAAARSGPTANPGAVPAEAGVAANPLATETHPTRATEVPAPPVPDAPQRPAAAIVRLMFSRWVQENDFKYLDQHFGINQITSYGVIRYAELKGQLTDRQIQSGAARALAEQARQLRAQLGRLLWAQREAETRHTAAQARRAELEPALPPSGAAPNPSPESASARRELARLKTATRRHETRRAPRQEAIVKLETQLTQTLNQAAQTDPTVSRLEDLITRGMVRLDTGPKRLLDAIKVAARNEFYRALAPFRKTYDNYRDDHDHFRRLSQSGGVLRWNGRALEVHLLPATNYGAALRQVCEQVLAELNATAPQWPDGSGRRLSFRLAQRSELEISLRSD